MTEVQAEAIEVDLRWISMLMQADPSFLESQYRNAQRDAWLAALPHDQWEFAGFRFGRFADEHGLTDMWPVYRFANADDALLFKLTFGGV